MSRRIAVVTTSRADWSHLYWVVHELRAHPAIDLQLLVAGAHLEPRFGHTVDEIEQAGFAIHARIPCQDPADTDLGMATTIGQATLGLAPVLAQVRPDLLLLIADRYEMLAPACAALALRVPMAHIEGGDVSEGAIDDAVRNALTKMSHLHFTPTERARQRVLAMGEEPWRVQCAGAPSLDHLRRSTLPDRGELEHRLGTAVAPDAVVVAYHPVTLARDTLREADAVFAALEQLQRPVFFCFPNADAGSRALIRRAEAFCAGQQQRHLLVNLDPITYWALLQHAGAMLGNSSSGIMESPSLGLPAVNIGFRQAGRERAANVIDAAADAPAIAAALAQAFDPAWRARLAGLQNPYGDGDAARRIVQVLASAPLGEQLLHKRPMPLPAEGGPGFNR